MTPGRVAGMTMAALVAALATSPIIAQTDTMDLDPVLAAKVAKEKAKSGAAAAKQKKSVSADKATVSGVDECGVNIGNIDSGKAGGSKGVATPRENTVVISGPVINLGKCKK